MNKYQTEKNKSTHDKTLSKEKRKQTNEEIDQVKTSKF